ncbi:Protein of unknown function, partial [Cotesia congregata]
IKRKKCALVQFFKKCKMALKLNPLAAILSIGFVSCHDPTAQFKVNVITVNTVSNPYFDNVSAPIHSSDTISIKTPVKKDLPDNIMNANFEISRYTIENTDIPPGIPDGEVVSDLYIYEPGKDPYVNIHLEGSLIQELVLQEHYERLPLRLLLPPTALGRVRQKGYNVVKLPRPLQEEIF